MHQRFFLQRFLAPSLSRDDPGHDYTENDERDGQDDRGGQFAIGDY